jgi:hypothetical protein
MVSLVPVKLYKYKVCSFVACSFNRLPTTTKKEKMFSQISTRITSRSNVLTRRALHMTSIARNEGATASSKGFGQKEKAVENQWARSHVSKTGTYLPKFRI